MNKVTFISLFIIFFFSLFINPIPSFAQNEEDLLEILTEPLPREDIEQILEELNQPDPSGGTMNPTNLPPSSPSSPPSPSSPTSPSSTSSSGSGGKSISSSKTKYDGARKITGGVNAIYDEFKVVPNAGIAIFDLNVLDPDKAKDAELLFSTTTDDRGYYEINIPANSAPIELYIQVICGNVVHEFIRVEEPFIEMKLDSRLNLPDANSCGSPKWDAVPYLPEELEYGTDGPREGSLFDLPILDPSFGMTYNRSFSVVRLLLQMTRRLFDWIGELGLRRFHIQQAGSDTFRGLSYGVWKSPANYGGYSQSCSELDNELKSPFGIYRFGMFQKTNVLPDIKEFIDPYVTDLETRTTCDGKSLASLDRPWEQNLSGNSGKYWPGELFGRVDKTYSNSSVKARHQTDESEFRVTINGPGNDPLEKKIFHPGEKGSMKSVEDGQVQVASRLSMLGSSGEIPDMGVARSKTFARLNLQGTNDTPFAYNQGEDTTRISPLDILKSLFSDIWQCIKNVGREPSVDEGKVGWEEDEKKQQSWWERIQACGDASITPFSGGNVRKVMMPYLSEWEASTNDIFSHMFMVTDPYVKEEGVGFLSAGDQNTNLFSALASLLAKNRITLPIAYDLNNKDRLMQYLSINYPYSPGANKSAKPPSSDEVNCNKGAPEVNLPGVLSKEEFATLAGNWVGGSGKHHALECYNDVVGRAIAAGINPAFALLIWINESGASNYAAHPYAIEDFGIHGGGIPTNNFDAQISFFLGLPSAYSSICGSSDMSTFAARFLTGSCTPNSNSADYLNGLQEKWTWVAPGCPFPTYPTDTGCP